MSQISEDDWYAKYKPVVNHIDPDASWRDDELDGGIMFETYGEELDYVMSQIDNNTVWTYMDSDDGGTCVVAGYSIVNRIGYFITEVAWESDDLFWTVIDGKDYCPNDEGTFRASCWCESCKEWREKNEGEIG